jgi:60 kDa SS-A/Ro ribonucleoprotein
MEDTTMAHKTLFRSIVGKLLPPTDARNDEGAPAYRFSPRHALAQFAATGCLNGVFYSSAAEQLAEVLVLCEQVDAESIARVAIYARERGHMKDLPALLCAVLTVRDPRLLRWIFDRVIDNAKMLRNFVQIVRSGVVGRKSLGTLPKRLVCRWLESRTDEQVFRGSVGNDPSLADILKMVHPKPGTPSREALYAWILGRDVDEAALPEIVRQFEAFKAERGPVIPNVPFQMLTALELSTRHWASIAESASWQATRMNLNTFARHGVFGIPGLSARIAEKLRDPAAIARARVFPYQLLVAYRSADSAMPAEVRDALQDALEVSLSAVPTVDGQIYVCPDVSGSMQCPVTGYRRGSTSAVRCVDVAALVAAAIQRKNPTAMILPFEHEVVPLAINPRDSVLTNAERLASVGGGGTSCSAPLAMLNARRARGDLVIFVSDNESWVDAGQGRGTRTLHEWQGFRQRNPQARLVCLDLQPNTTTQARDRDDILNLGGFSDAVFEVLSDFAVGRLSPDHWVGAIESVEIASVDIH